MWQDSRDQIGCSIAALMAISAAFALRATFRGVYLAIDPQTGLSVLHAIPVMVGLTIVVVAIAFFAVRLKRWSIGAYLLCCLAGIAFALIDHLGRGVWGPLLIGSVAVTAIVVARRDFFP